MKKDATTELRKSYIKLLSDIIINDKLIPVYDTQVNDTVEPYTIDSPPSAYIIISNQNSYPRDNKQAFEELHTIQVTVYTLFPVNQGGFYLVEQIDEQVKALILGDKGSSIEVKGFNCYVTKLDLSRGDIEASKTNNIFKRTTIFNHYLTQL